MFKFFSSFFKKPLPVNVSPVPRKLQLEARPVVPLAVRQHALHTALSMLKDANTSRTKVHSETASTEVYLFESPCFPGWSLKLYRPFGLFHSWEVLGPKFLNQPRRSVILQAAQSIALDEAEFYDAERRKETLTKEDEAFISSAVKFVH